MDFSKILEAIKTNFNEENLIFYGIPRNFFEVGGQVIWAKKYTRAIINDVLIIPSLVHIKS